LARKLYADKDYHQRSWSIGARLAGWCQTPQAFSCSQRLWLTTQVDAPARWPLRRQFVKLSKAGVTLCKIANAAAAFGENALIDRVSDD
jgi:hypothetical protein